MTGILIATHGNFAPGGLQSASMIFGEQPDVAAVSLLPSEGPEDIRRKMEEAVKTFSDPEQVLILVDLWGGTPFNQANGMISGHEGTWAIVAGLNLPAHRSLCIAGCCGHCTGACGRDCGKRNGRHQAVPGIPPARKAGACNRGSTAQGGASRGDGCREWTNRICPCAD